MPRLSFLKSSILAAAALAVLVVSPLAEAKRLGGGRSYGMQRQVSPTSPASAPSHMAPQKSPSQAAPTQPAPAPAVQPKRNWLGPIAGLAAGLGIAALLSHFGLGEGMANILMIALLAMAAVAVLRLVFARRPVAAPQAEPIQYAGVGGPSYTPMPEPIPATPPASAAGNPAPAAPEAIPGAGPRVPADFDVNGFLDVAKRNFIRLQAANDSGRIDEIRDLLTPEMFTLVSAQLAERGGATQTTDVVQLNASVLEVVNEGARYIASVRYYGLLREEANAPAAPFDEVWHLVKSSTGNDGWHVAGIQQLD